VGEKELSYTAEWECELVQPLWKTVWKLLKKLKIELSYDPDILLLRIYLKECKSGCNKCTWPPMFMAALFTIANLCKKPRCPTTNKWIKKMWYLYTMEFYSATKKNEILSSAGKWVELENIIKVKLARFKRPKATNTTIL
jgi:hypothetical protein